MKSEKVRSKDTSTFSLFIFPFPFFTSFFIFIRLMHLLA